MIEEDLQRAADKFFPGTKPDMFGRIFEIWIILLAIGWFFLYRQCFYKNDRRVDYSHWGEAVNAEVDKSHTHAEADNTLRPDVVLVFTHPRKGKDDDDDDANNDSEHPDAGKKLSAKVIRSTLSDKVLSGKSNLPRISPLANGHGATLLEVREKLLQDIVEILPEHGIQIGIFGSIDGDELFVCLMLGDEDWIRHYVLKDQVRLQLNGAIIKDLGVDEPADHHVISLSSPPYFRYDHRLANDLYGKHGSATPGDLKNIDDNLIYRTYGANRSILTGIGRIRIVTRLLMEYVDLDRAVKKGILAKWFPCHGTIKLEKLRRYWGNWKLITDLSCVQPLPLIQEYFSSRVAFVFAWNGLYAKFLLALVPVAMIFCLADVIAEKYGEASLWTQGTVLGFSLVVAYWGKFVANQWRREEAYLRVLWDLEGIGQDAAVRPDFHGEEVPSPIDKNMKMQEYPIWKFRLRQAASWSITLAFCSCVVTFVLAWKEQFPGNVSLMGSVVLALMIQLFTFTFSNLVEFLTIHENHKLQRHYYESYLRKTFVFEFINQYTAFFYIAIKQQFAPGGCPLNAEGQHDCLLALKKQLPSTLLILMAMEIVQVVLANVKVRASLQWEYFSNERKRTHSYLMALRSVRSMCCGREQTEEENRHHNFVEVQGKFGPYRTREQIETMTRLCLNIGFCLIFGGVVPIIVPMCLLAFFVQLRARATLLTSATDRPVPRRTTGLGPWLSIIELLMDIAVVFNAYVLVNYGPLFTGLPTLSKLSGFILYVFVVKAMWSFHDVVSPASSDLAELLHQRREHIVSKLLIKESECRRNKAKKKEEALEKTLSRHVHTNFVEEALKGEWDKIPTISKMSPAIAHQMGLC